jgi:uncharacterized protein YdcH (DUF465 family)
VALGPVRNGGGDLLNPLGGKPMYGVRHHILEEFPDLSGTILNMKNSDPQFASLLSRYDETDKKIYGIEAQSRPVADEYVEFLKKERLLLKDRLYSMINKKS